LLDSSDGILTGHARVSACGFRRLRPGNPIERGHAFRSKGGHLFR
jgi:hypothetical protein